MSQSGKTIKMHFAIYEERERRYGHDAYFIRIFNQSRLNWIAMLKMCIIPKVKPTFLSKSCPKQKISPTWKKIVDENASNYYVSKMIEMFNVLWFWTFDRHVNPVYWEIFAQLFDQCLNSIANLLLTRTTLPKMMFVQMVSDPHCFNA